MEHHANKFKTLTFEVKDSWLEDILTDDGFILLLTYILAVRQMGIVLMAPVCSSWCWLNRYTSGRDRHNWAGDVTKKSVREANMMVARCILLLKLVIAKGCVFVIEQPLGSILDAHERFQQFIGEHCVYRVSGALAHGQPHVILDSCTTETQVRVF